MHSSGRERVLVIMAKAPRPGAVKTRLAPSLYPRISLVSIAVFWTTRWRWRGH